VDEHFVESADLELFGQLQGGQKHTVLKNLSTYFLLLSFKVHLEAAEFF
jgi:hypothetical protein